MTILLTKKEGEKGRTRSFRASYKQQRLCQVSAAAERFRLPAGVTDSLSSRHVGPPHLPGLAVFIDSAIFLLRLEARKSDTPVKDLSSREREKKKTEGERKLVLVCRSSSSNPPLLPLPSALAPLQQLSARFHSDATQTRLIVVFVISPSEGKTSSPTPTPTPLVLQN